MQNVSVYRTTHSSNLLILECKTRTRWKKKVRIFRHADGVICPIESFQKFLQKDTPRHPRQVMGFAKKGALTLAIAVVAVVAGLYFQPRANIPSHLLHHKLVYQENFIPSDVGDHLLDLIKGFKEFRTNANDLTFYGRKMTHEHIGEAIPIGPNGTCDHPFLMPSTDKKECVLPGRIDVGRHYILSGGPEGLKESYYKLVSRVQSFGRYTFDLKPYPVVQQLFNNKSFLDVAQAVCPEGKKHLDPFQFNFISQIPGQTVAMHVDAPYMWGATRFQFPQWLLASMVFSGLFQDRFINQVQVVGYVHRWQDPEGTRQGEFIYWDDENPTPKREKPLPLAGSAVDGSKVIHAAIVYQPNVVTPFLDKSKNIVLQYRDAQSDVWELKADDEVLQEFKTDDLRISVVYRARCFKDAEEAQKFKDYPEEKMMTLDHVLSTLGGDLVKRGRITAEQLDYYMKGTAPEYKDLSEARLAFALKIMDEFIKYPLAAKEDAVIPVNYCAVDRLVPWMKPILDLFC